MKIGQTLTATLCMFLGDANTERFARDPELERRWHAAHAPGGSRCREPATAITVSGGRAAKRVQAQPPAVPTLLQWVPREGRDAVLTAARASDPTALPPRPDLVTAADGLHAPPSTLAFHRNGPAGRGPAGESGSPVRKGQGRGIGQKRGGAEAAAPPAPPAPRPFGIEGGIGKRLQRPPSPPTPSPTPSPPRSRKCCGCLPGRSKPKGVKPHYGEYAT